jgi:hypothetical protein
MTIVSVILTYDGRTPRKLNDFVGCAIYHKRERNQFIQRLQTFAADKQVRITILSGDVHLAAVGRFFSAPRLNIPQVKLHLKPKNYDPYNMPFFKQNKDPRYMVNVISSAITNAPPPLAVANLMHRRNKNHFLDRHTQENLMGLFREDPQGRPRKCCSTLPARNYVIITEHAGLIAQNTGSNGNLTRDEKGSESTGGTDVASDDTMKLYPDMKIAKTERGGTVEQNISAAAPATGTTRPFSIDVAFRVEIDSKDPEGRTKAYGFSIPALEL